MLENQVLKIPKNVPKWVPKWVRTSILLGALGALVGHLGPEVPHKGPKGSKMIQNAHKTIKNDPCFSKNIETRIMVFCSPSASKAPGAWRGGVLPKAAQYGSGCIQFVI